MTLFILIDLMGMQKMYPNENQPNSFIYFSCSGGDECCNDSGDECKNYEIKGELKDENNDCGDDKNGIYCTEHKKENMIDIKN